MSEQEAEYKVEGAQELVAQLVSVTAEIHQAKDALDAATDRMWETPEASNVVGCEELLETARENLAALEAEVRRIGLAEYQETGDKQGLVDGYASIRTKTSFEYDEASALNWAIEHYVPWVLKVDARPMKRHMQELTRAKRLPSWVTATTEDTVTLSRKRIAEAVDAL